MIGAVLRAAAGPRARELEALAKLSGTPLPVRRRIGVAALKPASGTTTVSAALCLMLARLRRDRILAITTSDPQQRPFADLGEPHSALRFSPAALPDPRESWAKVAGEAQWQHHITVTDWGAAPIPQLPMLAATSHALCLVAPAHRTAIEQTLDFAVALGERTPTCIAVVDVTGKAAPSFRALTDRLPLPAAFFTHARPAGGRSERDRFALYRLTAAVVSALAHPKPRRAAA